VTLGVGTLAADPAAAAGTAVYKCFDKSLSVLYTDEPCAGELMNIRAGDADPMALAELQRERDNLARSTAQRLADYRRAELERFTSPQWVYQRGDNFNGYPDAAYYSPFGVAFLPSMAPPNRLRTSAKPAARERRTVSNPPHITVPR
jgi:hypothetical protein